MKVICPKCVSRNALVENENDVDLVINCLCGYRKVIATVLSNKIEISHVEIDTSVKLPKENTKLYKCLLALVTLKQASTIDITNLVNRRIEMQLGNSATKLTTSEVASFLVILRYKGLIDVLDFKKGVVGGSSWGLTQKCIDLLYGV